MLGHLTENQIDSVLRSLVIGRIGCYADKRIYVVPVSFAYHRGYIYAHSKDGQKVKMMRKNPSVCFQADSMDNMVNWRSVIAWGDFEELTAEKEKKAGMKILVDRLAPYMTSETVRPTHGLARAPEVIEKQTRVVVFRIKVKEKSGRYEKTSLHEISTE